MKQRLTLSLLSVVALLVYAVPEIPVGADGLAGSFALIWLVFCLMAFGGNLAGLMFRKRKQPDRKAGVEKTSDRMYRRSTGI